LDRVAVIEQQCVPQMSIHLHRITVCFTLAMSAATPSHPAKSDCTHTSLQERGSIALPVLASHKPRGEIRKSKNARRRAIVLATVQLVLIAHIALWVLSRKYGWFGGKTITPIEPSESMEFSKHGVVNAGLIFFAVALFSTLILGRWFCGWGCHVVLLQDWCGWMMKKCGVRPRAFRSRFLIYVPLLLAIYMFILPAVHRWGLVPLDASLTESLGEKHALVQTIRVTSSALGFPLPYQHMPEWKITTHLTTNDFWKTFATYGVAIPFLFVCGFAVVYFLGSKGFCTYGCPYGGFFAPIDRLAPARILVTDACEGCGHCTAVCTSNVRVHEEVREYGMVVDPGCMKCMDCVSVCPNEALYFGFAKPALLKGAAKNQKPRKIYDLTLGEEFVFSAVFFGSFLAVRGIYGLVPMLMAAGLAGIVTFLTWKSWRMLRDPNVTFHKWQLKLRGALRPAGWVFAAAAAFMMLFTLHSGVVNAAITMGLNVDDKVVVAPHAPFGEDASYLTPQMLADADRAIKYYRVASIPAEGGIALAPTQQFMIDLKIARLLTVKREFDAALQMLRRSIARDGEHDALCSSVMWVLYGLKRGDEALAYGEDVLLRREDMSATIDTYMQFCQAIGDTQRPLGMARKRYEAFPNDLKTMRVLSILLMQSGEVAQSVALTQRTIEIDPSNGSAYFFLAGGLYELGQLDKARDAALRAREMLPHSVPVLGLLSDIHDRLGRRDEAERFRREAQRMHEEQMSRLPRDSEPIPKP